MQDENIKTSTLKKTSAGELKIAVLRPAGFFCISNCFDAGERVNFMVESGRGKFCINVFNSD